DVRPGYRPVRHGGRIHANFRLRSQPRYRYAFFNGLPSPVRSNETSTRPQRSAIPRPSRKSPALRTPGVPPFGDSSPFIETMTFNSFYFDTMAAGVSIRDANSSKGEIQWPRNFQARLLSSPAA